MLPIIIAAAAVGLGLYAISRPSSPSGPTYRVAPGGVGRIYGTPDVPIGAAFWVGPEVKIGCRRDGSPWVAEGARFLPADITVKHPRSSLAEALAAEQSAWPYVDFLYRQPFEELIKDVPPSDRANLTWPLVVTAMVVGSAGGMGAVAREFCKAETFGRAGLAPNNWGLDVMARIQDFENVRGYGTAESYPPLRS